MSGPKTPTGDDDEKSIELGRLREMVSELQGELDETNRGVVALYAELDDQAEQLRLASQRSESKFQTVYSHAPNGIGLLDNDGRFVDCNPALSTLLTSVDRSVIGHRLADYVPVEFHPRVDAFCSPVAGALAGQEVPIRRQDGSLAYVEWNVSSQIEPGVTMVVATDVSQRVEIDRNRSKWLERERVARGDAEHGSRIKDDFIAVLAHELRTPLNAIMGWTQVLRKRGGNDEAMRGVVAIERNCTTQARMISDLLDMSRLNMGKLVMTFEDVDPLREVNAAVDAMSTALEQKAIKIDVRAAHGGYRLVNADASRLQQVIWNLLSNAIKFSSHGGHVVVSLDQDDTGLFIQVRDAGQGIAADFLPLVFERFAQSDAASNRQRGGLGLGLSIVRQIVEAHGGTVSVHSDGPGLGTIFRVWLPIHRPSSNAERTGDHSLDDVDELDSDHPLANLRILIVDDDQDTLAMLRIILVDKGGIVTAASTADEALECLERDPPHLLISDIGMPDHDGYELLRRIRANEQRATLPSAWGTRLPAIALTSFTRDEDREQALIAGFDAHCGKPIQPLILLRQIVALLASRRPSEKTAS